MNPNVRHYRTFRDSFVLRKNESDEDEEMDEESSDEEEPE